MKKEIEEFIKQNEELKIQIEVKVLKKKEEELKKSLVSKSA